MKKSEIMNLLKSETGTLRINPICTLRRWTYVDGHGSVDKLAVDFSAVCETGRFMGSVEIKSRDYDGIISEVDAAIRYRMAEVTEYLCKALRNGYTI